MPETEIDNLKDLICNIKEVMKDFFMPRDELNTTYSKTTHTHTYDNNLSSSSTNAVQNKIIKSKFDTVDTEIDGKANVNHDHSNASANSDGFLSSTMFTKLNGIQTGATKTTVSNSLTDTSTTNALSAAQGKALNDNKAPTSHASQSTAYGPSSASNYGHSMASSTTPKDLAASASLGSETTKFARGDHVHKLPPVASSTTNGLMTKEQFNKLDSVVAGATVNNRGIIILVESNTDTNNGPIVEVSRGSPITFSIYDEFYNVIPSNYKIFCSFNGTVNSYSHRGNMNISSTFTPGDYPMNIIFKGGGPYNVCYRTVIIRVTA